MSRTKKDRPYRVLVKDKTAYPESIRYAHHEHWRFGEPHYYAKRAYDEVEKKFIEGERVLQGHFADYCTVDVDQRNLPPGTLAPCWTYSWAGADRAPNRWERASKRAQKRGQRGRSHREQVLTIKLAASGESVGEESMTPRRRDRRSY